MYADFVVGGVAVPVEVGVPEHHGVWQRVQPFDQNRPERIGKKRNYFFIGQKKSRIYIF